MVSLTQRERETLLILFKDFTTFYNANFISKILGISHVGAQKIFKRLYNNNILTSKKIAKSIVYKLKLDDDYVNKFISFLLVDEANKFKRWKEEFKDLFKKGRIILMFGSVIKNYDKARDIDIMIVIDKKDIKEINKILKEKEKILPKKIHAIKLTHNDLLENIKNKDKAIIDIVKNAIVIYGEDKYVEIIKNVASL
ncbi:MAG: nucleotidyltransferase domain-containing protein [Nanoarchaeota archaeon]|nr:nucleotidyltransferase domain-containing protein [Nanoarchaeota archaeon]